MADDCWICKPAHDGSEVHILPEDSRLLAFLDRGPIRAGHTQIVSKEHFPYLDEAPAEVVSSIVLLGQRLAVARIGPALDCLRHLFYDAAPLTSWRWMAQSNTVLRRPSPS